MHGFDSYPQNLKTLIELGSICGSPQDSVVVDVLTYLNREDLLSRKDKCPYLPQMIRDYLIPYHKGTIDNKLSNYLLQVVRQDQSNVLLQFLITNIDKSSDDFAAICELKYTQQGAREHGI